MPGLLTYTTDLKSLKFGVPPVSDRPGGGNSGQPYIVDPIPGQNEPIPDSDLAAPDFLLRGGINSAADATDDVLRLGKYFFNFKNVNGALFVAKQNELSAIAVQTQATGNGTGLGLNEGVYTPLSTLAQAGIGFLGGHVDKQGINPFRGVTTYSDVSQIVIGASNGDGNRLVNLYNTQVPNQGNDFSLENPTTLYSYYGGPNSILGLGNTNIRFATDNKGAPISTGITTSNYQAGLRENPTDLFVIKGLVSGNSIDNKYRNQTGETINSVLTKDDGISWRETLINPYATGVKGTLAKKEYVPRNFNTANPTDLFVYPTGDDATSMYMFTTGEFVNSDLTSDDGISWRENLTNPYATGVKGTLATKNYVSQSYQLSNPINQFQLPIGASEKYRLQQGGGISNTSGTTNYTYTSLTGGVLATISGENGITWVNVDQNTTISPNTPGATFINPSVNKDLSDQFLYPTGSTNYSKLLNTNVDSGSLSSSNGKTWELQGIETSVYKPNTLDSNNRIKDNNTEVLTHQQINNLSKRTSTNKPNPGSEIVNFQQTVSSIAPNYKNKEIIIDNDSGDNRNSYRSPGLKSSEGKIIDKVNAQPIYRSSDAEVNNSIDRFVEDLIPFRIGAINPQGETVTDYGFEKDYIHFRAYIDNFNDSYTGNWNSTKYMGRGEKLYSYDGFDRTINLGFTVAAQSRDELLEQYKKLNFLVSNLAPEYTNAGYMNGPLVTLTMGGWCYELPGFIEGITLDVPEESPWETGVDNNIATLPHIVKVSGFTFKPIHDFKPQKQQNTFDTDTQHGKLTNYGTEDYVSIRSRYGVSMENNLVNSKPQ